MPSLWPSDCYFDPSADRLGPVRVQTQATRCKNEAQATLGSCLAGPVATETIRLWSWLESLIARRLRDPGIKSMPPLAGGEALVRTEAVLISREMNPTRQCDSRSTWMCPHGHGDWPQSQLES